MPIIVRLTQALGPGKIIDIPNVLLLKSVKGDPVGAVLLAPNETRRDGDCVFMLSPTSSVGIDSDMGIVVSELKVAGEHRYGVTAHSGGVSLYVHPNGLPDLEFRLDLAFKGNVLTEFDGIVKTVGSAQPIPRST